MITLRKAFVFAIFALLFAFLGISIAQNAQDTADINNIFEMVVNNSDLCQHNHTSGLCEGSRVANTTYNTSAYPIQLLIFGHAATAGQTAELHIFVNGTKVQDLSLRPLGGAEQTNTSLSIIIPRFSNYSLEVFNIHHYEWREYPILAGKNGTLSINQTIVGSTGDINTKVNKSGDNMTGDLNLSNNDLLFVNTIGKAILGGTESLIQFVDSTDPQIVMTTNKNASFFSQIYNSWQGFQVTMYKNASIHSDFRVNDELEYFYQNVQRLLINGTHTKINNTLDMMNNNITNCANCIIDINSKVNKTGDNITGDIDFFNNSNFYLSLSNTNRSLKPYNNWVLDTFTPINTISENTNVIWSLATLSNNTAENGFFGAHRAKWNGTTNTLIALENQTQIFTFFGKGYDGSSWTTSRSIIRIMATGNWTTTSHPTKIFITTTSPSDVTNTLTYDEEGRLTNTAWAGTGNRYLCVAPNGTSFPGNPTC